MKSVISIVHMVRSLGCSYCAMTSRSENWMVRLYKTIPLISYDVVRRYENRTNNGGSAELKSSLGIRLLEDYVICTFLYNPSKDCMRAYKAVRS